MIGIYGGTFDPVHFGHLRPALDVYSELELAQIRFIPCGQPPHRELPVATGQQRYEMLNLAIEGQAAFVVDDRELNRDGPSYMVDTIISLQTEFNDETFCLVVGMDAFLQFDSWKDWQEITHLVNIVVTHRPNIEIDSMPNLELNHYLEDYTVSDPKLFIGSKPPCCYFCAVTQLDLSSTKIRELVVQHKSIDYLVPDKVAAYIEQQRIYI